MNKNEKQCPDLEKIVASAAAVGLAIGGVTTYSLIKSNCDDCDCEKKNKSIPDMEDLKLSAKNEYKEHKESNKCFTCPCDTCPHHPKNNN